MRCLVGEDWAGTKAVRATMEKARRPSALLAGSDNASSWFASEAGWGIKEEKRLFGWDGSIDQGTTRCPNLVIVRDGQT